MQSKYVFLSFMTRIFGSPGPIPVGVASPAPLPASTAPAYPTFLAWKLIGAPRTEQYVALQIHGWLHQAIASPHMPVSPGQQIDENQ